MDVTFRSSRLPLTVATCWNMTHHLSTHKQHTLGNVFGEMFHSLSEKSLIDS